MLLTVSGPPGSGKSTTAAALAERFDLSHTSGGDIFRSVAAERGVSVGRLNEIAEEDPSIDKDLDRRLQQIAAEKDDVVLESRLAGWLSADHAAFRIWLDAPLDVRAERIAERENKEIDTARIETEQREESEADRYEEYYDINIRDLSIYDIHINTARWGPEDVPEIIEHAIAQYNADKDEGQAPINTIEI